MATRKWIKKEKPERFEFWVNDVRYAIVRFEPDDSNNSRFFTYYDGSNISIDNKATTISEVQAEVEKNLVDILKNKIGVLKDTLSRAELELMALEYANKKEEGV